MGFPVSHQPRWCITLTSQICVFCTNFNQKPLKVCYRVLLSRNFQRQSCSAINYLSNDINILAGDDPVSVKFGPKGTDHQQEGCTFPTRRTVQSAIADLSVWISLMCFLWKCQLLGTSCRLSVQCLQCDCVCECSVMPKMWATSTVNLLWRSRYSLHLARDDTSRQRTSSCSKTSTLLPVGASDVFYGRLTCNLCSVSARFMVFCQTCSLC